MTALGAAPGPGGTRVTVWSSAAERIWVCPFDARTDAELDRIPLDPAGEGLHSALVRGKLAGGILVVKCAVTPEGNRQPLCRRNRVIGLPPGNMLSCR